MNSEQFIELLKLIQDLDLIIVNIQKENQL